MDWGSFDEDVVLRYGSTRSAWVFAGVFAFVAMMNTAGLVASGGDWKVWASVAVFSMLAVLHVAIAMRRRVIADDGSAGEGEAECPRRP